MRLRIRVQATARRLADAARGAISGSARYASLSRGAPLALATATALLAYSVMLLWPFDWKLPAGYVENRAEFLPEGGIRFTGPGIARTPAPPAWVAAAMRAQELEVQLQVRPFASEQVETARIMTLSLDHHHHHRNFTIGQGEADLILRLRTPASDLNGRIDHGPVARIPEVFRFMRWVTIGLRIEPGQLELSVDGQTAARRSLPADPFQNWDPSYRLAFGMELTTHVRPWLGEIRRAVVRVGNTEIDYARSSELEMPERLWMVWSSPRLTPFQWIFRYPGDIVANVILFIPLGLLIGAWLGRRTRQATWCAILLLAAISASFETLQLFLPDRSASIDDVIANTLGGTLGVLLVRWLSAPAAAAAAREDA